MGSAAGEATSPTRSWLFLIAAALPCALLLLFCGTGIHEWWLISTHQIVVAPRPVPGVNSIPEVPASSLLPLIFLSGALAAMFGYALLRGSRKLLAAAYLVAGLVAGLAWLARTL